MESVTSENITNEFLAFNQSQWTSNGSNIYLNTSVGIGTSLPRANLDVYGSINALSASFGTVYTGATVFSTLNVSGNANIVGNLTVSNLIVTGNLVNVTTNLQISNSVTINNAGTSTALKVVQLENVPVHTNNVAEFWDYQTLALLINGDGNVGIHTTVVNPHAFAVVGSSNIDYIKTINVYSSNAVVASNLYGNVVGSNTVSASRLYGPVVGSNTVSASGLYGPVVGSNTISGTTISGSILYGPLAGSNTIVGSTIYGQIAGSNTISASTIYGQLAGSNTIAGSSLTLDTALSIANGGTGQTTKSAAFNALSPMTAAGDLIYGGASGSGTRLATGTTTQVLHGGTTPSWAAVSLTADVSGTLPVANGGIGLTSTSANFVFAGPTTGAAAAPTWRALVSTDIPANAASTSGSAGSLSTTYASGQILYGQASGVPASTSTFIYSTTGSGSIGIGTASATSNLYVTGNVYTTNAISTSNIVIAAGSPASIVLGSNVFVFSNAYGFSNIIVMNSAGQIGIGTTSPGITLDVGGPIRSVGIGTTAKWSIAATTGSGTSSMNADVTFFSTFFNYPTDKDNRRSADILSGFSTGTWGSEYMSFNVGNGAGLVNDAQAVCTERMRITCGGNVGIGTSSSLNTLLQVNGQISALGKAGYGVCPPIVYRQGGSTTNWNTSGTTNYTLTSGAVQMQAGTITMTASPTTITFPTAYTNNPIVLITAYTTTATTNPWVSAITTTTFSVTWTNFGTIEWIAIGI